MYTQVSSVGRLVTNGAVALTIDGLREQMETGSEAMRSTNVLLRLWFASKVFLFHELVSGGLNTCTKPRRRETRSPSEGRRDDALSAWSTRFLWLKFQINERKGHRETSCHLEKLSLSRTRARVLARQWLLSLWTTEQRRSQARSGTVVLRRTLETAVHGLSASSGAVCPPRTGDWGNMTQWTVETW